MSLDRESALDAAVRLRAFDFLAEQRRRFGESPLPRAVLDRGFDFEGTRVPLVGPQGIFKPAIIPVIPLSITTVPPVEGRDRPYDDGFTEEGSCGIATAAPTGATATTPG